MTGPYLLDVNVLISLVYQPHEFWERSTTWFEEIGFKDWASCPTTENGTIRILGGPKFPDRYPHLVTAAHLGRLADATNHRFIPDSISFLDDPVVDLSVVGTSARLTDTYLLSLAVHEGLMLATLDRRLDPSPVVNGEKHLYIIPEL